MSAQSLALLLDFGQRLLPGLVLFAACLLAMPMRAAAARIALYIAIFVLIRDAMTPMGLWRIGPDLRLGFHPDPIVLLALAGLSLGAVLFLIAVERDLRPLLVWSRGNAGTGALVGTLCGALLAAPLMFAFGHGTAKLAAGPGFVAALLALAMLGNLLEEVLFRGYLQSKLARYVSPLRAALLSGLIFAACHSYLAITVTDAGWPILAFTLAEGVVCGLLMIRYGLVGATLAHGTAIFLLAGPIA